MMRSNVVTTILPINEELTDPYTGEKVKKCVFISFLTSGHMLEKAKKVCEAFHCHMYDCPRMTEIELNLKIKEEGCSDIEIERLLTIIKQTNDNNQEYFWEVANQLDTWRTAIMKDKAIYHSLNKFHENDSETMQALVWIPSAKRDEISRILDQSEGICLMKEESEESLSAMKLTKPTYFATNKYTGAFQGIVNAYGVAKYKEANPTLFALSIFPFLFGVMFGDLLHGSFLLIFAVVCIIYEDKLKKVDNEMFVIPFGGRYLLLIMAVCAIYMGFIYNEIASVPLDLFGSAYPHGSATLVDASNFTTTPYPMGVDPVWRWSGNNVQFTNSLKMKMAIVMGIVHMTLGVLIKALNMLYPMHGEKGDAPDYISLINESIPEVLLFMSIFGYLIILIFVKWSTNWNVGADCSIFDSDKGTTTVDQACVDNDPFGRIQYPRGPPMIITTLIDLAFMGPVKHRDVLLFPDTCGPLPEDICTGQSNLQMFLLAIAGLCVPWLLLVKPFMLKNAHAEHNSHQADGNATEYEHLNAADTPTGSDALDLEGQGLGAPEEDDDAHSFAEIFIHQVIHTIEYALGTVSNTASYLRLWALSLAHSQLSEVFWNMIFVGGKFPVGLNTTFGAGMVVFCYFVWFGATMGVLMVMESLSAFLHALRLQWVEFQNKFYQSDGYLFMPDSFEEESEE